MSVTILGRALEFPASPGDWLLLAASLACIAVALKPTYGTTFATLGIASAFAGYIIDHHFYFPISIAAIAVIAHVARQRNPAIPSVTHPLIETLWLSIGYAIYETGRSVTEGGQSVALRHGRQVVRLERFLGLSVEHDLQAWIMKREFLLNFFVRIYSYCFLPTVLCAILWFMLTDASSFRVLRNGLGGSAALGLLTFHFYPVAPPRMLGDIGLVDIAAVQGRSHGFVNQFAAVPSLHVGWTFLVSLLLFRAYRHRWWSVVLWHPALLMVTAVVATGNHLFVDGIVGIAYVLIPASLTLYGPPARRFSSPRTSSSRTFGR